MREILYRAGADKHRLSSEIDREQYRQTSRNRQIERGAIDTGGTGKQAEICRQTE
jgi:hypothetical protein